MRTFLGKHIIEIGGAITGFVGQLIFKEFVLALTIALFGGIASMLGKEIIWPWLKKLIEGKKDEKDRNTKL